MYDEGGMQMISYNMTQTIDILRAYCTFYSFYSKADK